MISKTKNFSTSAEDATVEISRNTEEEKKGRNSECVSVRLACSARKAERVGSDGKAEKSVKTNHIHT